MHHEVPRQHLQRIHGAAGRPSPPPYIARGGEAVLAEELPVGEQHQLPGRQLQPFKLGRASGFERHRRVLLDQPLDRRGVAGVGHEAGDAVVFLQQGHSPRGLGREQPHPRPLRLKALDQARQLAELIGMGRHRAAGQIETVEVPVGFMQLGQVEAAEAFSLSQSQLGRAMQRTRQGGQLLLLEMILGMVKPLLAVSQAVAALIDGHQTVVGQIVEQAGGPLPGQTHQPAHSLGSAPLQQLLEGLGTQQLLQFSRHLLPQGLGHQRRVTGRGEVNELDRIEGALAGRIELAQLFQSVAEELQPHRQLGADRIEINNVAAAAPVALLLDRRHSLVAEVGERVTQRLEIDDLALAQAETLGRERLGGRQVGLECPLGGDDGHTAAIGASAAAGNQFSQHLQLAPGDLTGGVKGFIGGAFAGGIELAGFPAHQLQQGGPATRLLQGRHDHQQWRPRLGGQGTGDQGPGTPTGATEPQPLTALHPGSHLTGEGHLLKLAHQGGKGHGRQGSSSADPRNCRPRLSPDQPRCRHAGM